MSGSIFFFAEALFIDLSLMYASYVACYYNYLGPFQTFCLNYNLLYDTEDCIYYTFWT